jgi:hypothetical protein
LGGFNPWLPICSSLYSLRKLTPVVWPPRKAVQVAPFESKV